MNQAWKIEVEGRALNEALRRGIIALGWPKLGDLRAYPDEKAIKIKLSSIRPSIVSQCWIRGRRRSRR